MFVKLKENWPSNLRRSVRDKNGDFVKDADGNPIVFDFHPGEPIEVVDEDAIRSIQRDLGNALVAGYINEAGRFRAGDPPNPAAEMQVDPAPAPADEQPAADAAPAEGKKKKAS